MNYVYGIYISEELEYSILCKYYHLLKIQESNKYKHKIIEIYNYVYKFGENNRNILDFFIPNKYLYLDTDIIDIDLDLYKVNIDNINIYNNLSEMRIYLNNNIQFNNLLFLNFQNYFYTDNSE